MPTRYAAVAFPHEADRTPPDVDWSRATFRSFFENGRGESWLCWADPSGIYLSSSADSWKRHKVPLNALDDRNVNIGITLSPPERYWMDACLSAMTRCL